MNYTLNDLAIIALDGVPVIKDKQKHDLIFGLDEPKDCFDRKKLPAFLIEKLGNDVYNSIGELSTDYALAVVEGFEKRGITPIPCSSPLYPQVLLNEEYFPLCLYGKGDLSLLKEQIFTIVGSRKTLPNILRITAEVSQGLSEHFAIMTGVAEGGDYAATQGALESGKVISVLAGGFDKTPLSQLEEKVAANGLVLSPFPPYVPTQKFTYPIRNRIMASLSSGILVVSGGSKSGALITGEAGLEKGVNTYAFPYTIGSATGEGCNSLLKKGALLAENILDILPDFGINLKMEHSENSLTEEERAVLDVIREKEEAHVIEIAHALHTSETELMATLSALEIKNCIVRSGGNKFRPV